MKNYYKIMGVRMSASQDEIKETYRNLVKVFHPDVNQDTGESMMDLNEAYAVLSDGTKRKEYNDALSNLVFKRNEQNKKPGENPKAEAEAENVNTNRGLKRKTKRDDLLEAGIRRAFTQGYRAGQESFRDKENSLSKRSKLLLGRIRNLEEDSKRLINISNDQVRRIKLLETRLRDVHNEKKASEQKNKNDFEDTLAKLTAAQKIICDKEKELFDLVEENTRLEKSIDAFEDYINYNERSQQIEIMTKERRKKIREQRRLLKSTYYETLDVLYWDTLEKIEKNYKDFKIKYSKVADNEKRKRRYDNLERAFHVLSDLKSRNKYNKEINISEDEVSLAVEFEDKYQNLLFKQQQEKDKHKFLKYLEELLFDAETGNAEAQNILGELYYNGFDVKMDLDVAANWFKKAAEQNHEKAIYNYGRCLLNGEGTVQNIKEGEALIVKAEELTQNGSQNLEEKPFQN